MVILWAIANYREPPERRAWLAQSAHSHDIGCVGGNDRRARPCATRLRPPIETLLSARAGLVLPFPRPVSLAQPTSRLGHGEAKRFAPFRRNRFARETTAGRDEVFSRTPGSPRGFGRCTTQGPRRDNHSLRS